MKRGWDIFYSLSNTAPYEHAAELGRKANALRTTGDIRDTWQSVSRFGFGPDRWAACNGPGHWHDADMLVVSQVGWGARPTQSRLTPGERCTHLSLRCLPSAPLLIGCDMAQMDDFMRSLLTSDEVLAIDQDPLGKQATQASHDGDKLVYAKTLADGSTAVGLFNTGAAATVIAVHRGPWGEIPMAHNGHRLVRDSWRQQDLGTFGGRFEFPSRRTAACCCGCPHASNKKRTDARSKDHSP